MQRIAEAGHIHFDAVPAQWQRVFVTAHDVTPEWHIQMQAAFQEFTDSAISKTCNFGHDATEEYVEKIYRYAYKLGCKGVTVYRDASREMQVLSTGATAKKVQEQAANGQTAVAEALGRIAELEAELERTRGMLHDAEAENLQRRAKRSRPDLLKGSTRRIETPLGTMYVTITEDDRGQPFEVFISLGKAGGGGGGGGGERRGAPEWRDPAGLHRRLPRLRLAARVHRGLRQVPRVRILGVRLSGAGA